MRAGRLRARRRAERGAAAVEFALVLVLLLTLIFGVIQYGFYFYATQSASAAAREAARKSAVGDCLLESDLKQYVKDQISGANTADPVVKRTFYKLDGTALPDGTLSTDPAVEVGGRLTVRVEFQGLNMNFPFVPVPHGGKVMRSAEARVEDTNQGGGCP